MNKFKVGDAVRVIKKCTEGYRYRGNVGDVGTIFLISESPSPKGKYSVSFSRNIGWTSYILPNGYTGWNFSEDELELIKTKLTKPKPEFYELIINGDATVLKDSNGNVGVSKRDPADEYNLGIGVDYALKRLKGELPKFHRHHESRKNAKKKAQEAKENVDIAVENVEDEDPIIDINDIPNDELDWDKVPMGTPVLVRDDDGEGWRKGKFICRSSMGNYRALPYGRTTPDIYIQIKLDKGDDK